MPDAAPFAVSEATIDEIHAAMRAGTLTSRALCEAYLERIAAHDRTGARLNAIVAVNEQALAQADELDAAFARSGELSGPLHGIAVLVKDNIETVDVDTTSGSEALLGFRPEQDATAVRRLREAGAIILAKTALPDFATSWFSYSSVSGETRNPYALDHDPGGSSAGSGAGVAASLGTVGIGTDCGGSIRLPASFCNLVGIRSTPGVVPRTGSSFLVVFQDTIGPMARTVTDAVTVFDAMAGYDEADPYSVAHTIARAPARYRDGLGDGNLAGARLGLVRNALGPDDDPASAAVNAITAEAVAALRTAGAEVIEVEIPDLDDQIAATSQYVACSKHDIDLYLHERPALAELSLEQIVAEKRYHPKLDLIEAIVEGPDDPEDDPDYLRRIAARETFTRVLVNLMARERLDTLILPTTRIPAPSNAGREDWTVLTFPTNTLIASQTWTPAMTVPAGFTPDGIPVGLEFVGKPYDEPTVFRIGYGFEQATGHRRAPASVAPTSA